MLRCAARSGAVLLASVALAGPVACGGSAGSGGSSGSTVQAVTTTELLADFVRAVGGDRVSADSVIPRDADPHSYEPTPSDARRLTGAEVAFSNGLLLEQRSLIDLIEEHLAPGARLVPVAEETPRHGAQILALEESVDLDVPWLGLAVALPNGVVADDQIRLVLRSVEGPGRFFAYVTDTFGEPEVYFSTADGVGDDDSVTLPAGAHTHLNWVFEKPGLWQVKLAAVARDPTGAPEQLAEATFRFAVETTPAGLGTPVEQGHADIAFGTDGPGSHPTGTGGSGGDPGGWRFFVRSDALGEVPAGESVVVTPAAARSEVPADPRFSFLGAAGSPIWLLPQAVLGKHVHGRLDPHMWEDIANAKAYTRVIAETLAEVDPDGRKAYEANAERYQAELDEVSAFLRERVGRIAETRRKLVTTHDAFGYLAKAYGFEVVGFVVPTPGQEPSAAQLAELGRRIDELGVPAVFVEPGIAARGEVLRQVARDRGTQVCTLYGDALDDKAPTYVAMMRHNADELGRCLGGGE
jgi:anchored repeat ABC transporter substrate-binding protein